MSRLPRGLTGDEIDSAAGSPYSRQDEPVASLTPGVNEPDRAMVRAEVLLKFYQDHGEWNLLEKAIDILQNTIEDTEDSDDGLCSQLGFTYSQCLRERYMRGRDPEELENAITWAEDAITRTERSNIEGKPLALVDRKNHLALCLFTKVTQIEDCNEEVLNIAIKMVQGVLGFVREHELGRVAYVNTVSQLSLFHFERYKQMDVVDSLVSSIEIDYDILPDVSDQSSELVLALSNLAVKVMMACGERAKERLHTIGSGYITAEEWENEAISLMCRAMKIETPRKIAALEQALGFMLHFKRLPGALQTSFLTRCCEFLPPLVNLMPDLVLTMGSFDRKDVVSTFYGISRYAAASLLANDRCYEATQTLETGRGIVMSMQLNSNTDLADLLVRKPALAEEYRIARDELLAMVEDEALPAVKDAQLGRLNEIRRKIRTCAGFSDFDQGLSEGKLLQLGQQTDIVVLNITDIRSDAIMITKEGMCSLHLVALSEDDISDSSFGIQQLLAKTSIKDQTETFEALHKQLSMLLDTLWKSAVKPILNELGHRGRPAKEDEWPHVYWIPTGVLLLYPIHAAGPGLHRKDDTMRRVVSSYAPSLKMLYRSHRRWQEVREDRVKSLGPQPSCAAAFVMDETPGRTPLPLGMREWHIFKSKFNGMFDDVKFAPRPAKEEVVRLLTAGVSVCHFTCHGETNYDEPAKSMLLMKDWQEKPLTVSEIQNLDVKPALLASLSACFTANAGVENLQDETIHLASALQAAGFINVFGSLWYVGEQATLQVIEEFYNELATVEMQRSADQDSSTLLSPEQIAKAIHFAILKFREKTRHAANGGKGNPVAWTPFVHYGAC